MVCREVAGYGGDEGHLHEGCRKGWASYGGEGIVVVLSLPLREVNLGYMHTEKCTAVFALNLDCKEACVGACT